MTTASAIRSLTTPYVDTAAEQLSLALGEPALPCLASADATIAGHRVSLRILGASHQLVIDADAPTAFSETVACLPGRTDPLPSGLRRDGYRFESGHRVVGRQTLTDAVDTLLRRARDWDRPDRRCLLGTFPGDPLAVTAVFVDGTAERLTWDTWHAYPEASQLVVTRSEWRSAP